MKKCFSFVIVVMLFYSCTSDNHGKEFGEYFYKTVSSDNWHLRGVEIGEIMDSVKTKETSRLIKQSPELLYYETILGDSDYFNTSYYFDKSTLYEIRFDININNKEKSEQLYQDLNSFLSKQLGQSYRVEAYNIWKTKNHFSQKIELALSKDTTQVSKTKLFLSVADYDYK